MLITFFKETLGGAFADIKKDIKRKYRQKYGYQIAEFNSFHDFYASFQNADMPGVRDVLIKKACLSNFAPLCLRYDDIDELNYRTKKAASEAKILYDSLLVDEGITDNSLFIKVANGKARLSEKFLDYTNNKKMGFMNLSLARFKPLTENICYAALFESGPMIRQYTSPISGAPHIEPCMPVFYDANRFQELTSMSHIDVEISAKLMPLPYDWEKILRSREVQIPSSAYCLVISPNNDNYYAEITEATTRMNIDQWIVFQLPKLKLDLPFFFRTEPDNLESRKRMASEFAEIYVKLSAKNKVNVLFYSDYVEPPFRIKNPIFNDCIIEKLTGPKRRTIKKLV